MCGVVRREDVVLRDPDFEDRVAPSQMPSLGRPHLFYINHFELNQPLFNCMEDAKLLGNGERIADVTTREVVLKTVGRGFAHENNLSSTGRSQC